MLGVSSADFWKTLGLVFALTGWIVIAAMLMESTDPPEGVKQ